MPCTMKDIALAEYQHFGHSLQIWGHQISVFGIRKHKPWDTEAEGRSWALITGRRCGRDSTIEPTVHHVVSSGQSPRCERRGRGVGTNRWFWTKWSLLPNHYSGISVMHAILRQNNPPSIILLQIAREISNFMPQKKGTKVIWAPTCQSDVLLLKHSHYIWGFTLRSTRVKFG